MTDALKLLPLPMKCGDIYVENSFNGSTACFAGYSADQMQAYVLADRAQRQVSDADRLDWVMRNVSGKAWRAIGVVYLADCDRGALDTAIRSQQRRLARKGGAL